MAIGNDNFFVWDYSDSSDILNIHGSDKKVSGSAELADFTVDFDANDNVVGIEIEHASEFFEPAGISKKQLSSMKAAEFSIQKREANCLLVWVKLTVLEQPAKPNKVIKASIPLPTPVVR